MNKNILILLFGTICINGYSQEKFNKLSLEPIQLIKFNIINLEYERGFAKSKVGISLFFGKAGSKPIIIDDIISNPTGIDISLKFYSDSFYKSSFWYGGQINFSSKDIKSANNVLIATDLTSLSIVVKEGYQLIHKPFYADINLGLGYRITNDLFGKAIYYRQYNGIGWLFTWGINIGIVF